MRVERNETDETTLSPAQVAALAALIRGETATAAAAAAGVGRATLYRWQAEDAAFATELAEARRERTEALRASLWRLADVAVETLGEILESPTAPAAARVTAALRVLETLTPLQPEPADTRDPDDIRRDCAVNSLFRS